MTHSEIDELRVTIEKDLAWRNSEISFLGSLLNCIQGANQEDIIKSQNVYRKSLVMVLYAHFEGYFRFAFETYAYTLNELELEISKVIDVLCASSLNKEFNAYENSNNWIVTEDEFAKTHKRIANRILLLENIQNNQYNHLELPISSNFLDKTSIVHTESNLKPEVIDKILFGLGIHKNLGLDGNDFHRLMGLVSAFVKKRNGIAHGDNKNEFRDGVSEHEYLKFRNSYDSITNLIGPIITKSLNDKLYLKPEFR